MRPQPSASFEATLQPGIVLLAEYLIDREIERGDDWALYHAQHVSRASEQFHVRILRHDIDSHPEAIDAVITRATHITRLANPGVMPIVASGVDHERGYAVIVTRMRMGISLRDRLAHRTRKLTSAEIARIVCEVGDTLDALHAQEPPIVHGTLDSSRVFLVAPDASARLLGLDEASPDSRGVSADQFALASLAYECLTGSAPFTPGAPVNASSVPRLRLTGDLAAKSADLDWVLQRAWATDETRRFSSAGRFAEEIARLLGANNAMSAARARRPDAVVAAPRLPSSGTRPAMRLPTLGPAPASTSKPTAAPYTPPSGERAAILPNAGRYSYQPDSATRRNAPLKSPGKPTAANEIDSIAHAPPANTLSVDESHPKATQSESPRRSPPPLPVNGPPAVVQRTPTMIGIAVAPPRPALVAEVEVEAPEIELVTTSDPPAPPPSPPSAPVAVTPPVLPVPPVTIVPIAIPTPVEHTPTQRLAAEEIMRPAAPIPLVTVPLQHPVSKPKPRRRRFIHLAGACLLALAFGGADRLAPRIHRVAPDVWRWTARMLHRVSSTPAPIAPRAAAQTVTTPSPVLAPVQAPPPAAIMPPVVLTQRPDATQRAHASVALREVVNDCGTRVERAHRHARFSVAFDGRTGAASEVTFPDAFFRTHAIGSCIADGARHVAVQPFTDARWTGSYSIMVP